MMVPFDSSFAVLPPERFDRKRKFEEFSSNEKKTPIELGPIARYRMNSRGILPARIERTLDQYLVDRPADLEKRRAQDVLICRLVNEVFSDPQQWGKLVKLGRPVTHRKNRVLLNPASLFKDGKRSFSREKESSLCTSAQVVQTLWIKTASDGKTFDLHFVSNEILGEGAVLEVYASQGFYLDMRPSSYSSEAKALQENLEDANFLGVTFLPGENERLGGRKTIYRREVCKTLQDTSSECRKEFEEDNDVHASYWEKLLEEKRKGKNLDVLMSPPVVSMEGKWYNQPWYSADLKKALEDKKIYLDINPDLGSLEFSSLDALNVVEDIWRFVDWFGKKNRVHGDIKMPNINIGVVKKDGVLKIRGFVGDFDLANFSYSLAKKQSGKYFIWDPLASKNGIFTPLTDPYSLALMLCQVIIPGIPLFQLEGVRDFFIIRDVSTEMLYTKFIKKKDWEDLFSFQKLKWKDEAEKINQSKNFDDWVKPEDLYQKENAPGWSRLSEGQQKAWEAFYKALTIGKQYLLAFRKSKTIVNKETLPGLLEEFPLNTLMPEILSAIKMCQAEAGL